ncbi:hypothetical protein D3C75_921610 [compost metagenome]|uniref:Uncharacterized protein n=1 Tax=Paenibacillus jilunlii TaxID=682956 RepID=A0ABR5SLY7_9BACL|nr:hypothetical protein AML91_25425 [Paenibacillus jilunlii]
MCNCLLFYVLLYVIIKPDKLFMIVSKVRGGVKDTLLAKNNRRELNAPALDDAALKYDNAAELNGLLMRIA